MNVKCEQTLPDLIPKMDKHLRKILERGTNQLWESTFIYKQIEKRKEDSIFSLKDHIRAMVYSMLSSGTSWNNIMLNADIETGYITPVDKIFYNYDLVKISDVSPEYLRDKLKEIHCASQYTLKQMSALINVNIPKLKAIETEYDSIDTYYQEFIKLDTTLKTLVLILSTSGSKDKFLQMDTALVCEYLRNVGYDMAKPDRHIRRILGSNILACSEKEVVPVYEAFDIVHACAKEINKPVAEVDYILWSYCAKGYGEICTLNNPSCDVCVMKENCNLYNNSN